MATSTHYSAPYESDNIIIVSHEKNWKDVKVYAKGSLQYQASDGNELRIGKTLEVEGLGSLQLYLGTELEVRVDGVRYEASKTESNEKVSNVSVIFWVLCGFSAIGLLFLLFALNIPFVDTFYVKILIGLQLFAILVYGATAVLLKRGVYWFYFVGAGVYTVFCLLVLLDIQSQFISLGTIIAFIARFFLLVLVLRILPVILKRMRDSNASQKDDIILDQH
ncbi:MAG: hypothetical protein ACFHU9_07105 [Fluviicola sp.]